MHSRTHAIAMPYAACCSWIQMRCCMRSTLIRSDCSPFVPTSDDCLPCTRVVRAHKSHTSRVARCVELFFLINWRACLRYSHDKNKVSNVFAIVVRTYRTSFIPICVFTKWYIPTKVCKAMFGCLCGRFCKMWPMRWHKKGSNEISPETIPFPFGYQTAISPTHV